MFQAAKAGGAGGGLATDGAVQLFEFLRGLCHQGRPLMLNPRLLTSLPALQAALLRADRYLDEYDDEVRCVFLCVCAAVNFFDTHDTTNTNNNKTNKKTKKGAVLGVRGAPGRPRL